MKYLPGLLLLAAFSATAAESTTPAFSNDPSKPQPQVQIAPTEQDTTPASTRTAAQWQSYDAPLRSCIQGDTIIPTKDNKVLNYIFSNESDTNATLSVLGWKKGACAIDFTEGTLVKSCHFNHGSLKLLMDNLLNPTFFDPNGSLATVLTEACQAPVQT